MHSRLTRGQLLATTIIAGAAALAQPALAQDASQAANAANAPAAAAPTTLADAAPVENGARDEIVVTGSRIARPELQSVSPVAVVNAAQIQAQGITNVQDLVQKLPQAGIPGFSRTNTNFATTGNGISSINLRNLGSDRTLVLVNGRRFVAGVAGSSIVDVNNIPADFVERVEVLTGGASAAYGSDAVAGVVNFVLKDHYEGITARAQYGISSRGDNRNYEASITGGQTFGPDDRGSIIANFTYNKDAGLFSRDRRISAQDCLYTCGPESYSTYASQGRFQLSPGAPTVGGSYATGTSGAALNNIFTFDPQNNLVMGFPNGYGFNRNGARRIAVPLERFLGSANAKYELTDHLTAYVEGTYAKTKSSSQIEAAPLDSATGSSPIGAGYGIDNPFIPADIQAIIAARNSDADPGNDINSIQFRRRQNEVYTRSNTNSRDTFRIAGGIKGDITDKWSFDVSGVYGQLKDHTETEDIDTTKYQQALDAIRDPATGVIECRDPAARAAGCEPIDLFGHNTASAAASAYVRSAVPRTDDVKNTELVATASVTGTLFTLPAGDVKTNIGAEYRREKSVDNWDPLTNAGLNSGNQTPDTTGKFNVKELFGELDIPLLKDKPFFKSLSAQGQVRYSDYSTVGSVFSWNAGGEWSPMEGVRFRGNYAVATRAPNIGELYTAASETFPGVSDPCDGITATTAPNAGTAQIAAACRAIPGVAAAISNTGKFQYAQSDIQGVNGFNSGNPNLKEEKGKTITVGTVLTPRFLPGFSLTADYFNIKVSNAIALVSRDTSVTECLALGLPQFCNNVIRDPNTGFVVTTNSRDENISALRTSGLDVNLHYSKALGWLEDDKLDLNVLWTHTFTYKTQDDPSAPVRSGVGNIRYGEVFRDKINAILNYSVGPFSFNWTMTFLGKMVDDPKTFDNPDPDGANLDFLVNGVGLDPTLAASEVKENHIKARVYNDFQLRAKVGENDRLEVFFGVDNAFDRRPPRLLDGLYYGNITGTTTAADVYDVYGRRFYAGAQVHF
jgi:outer membrane receptor protein involved in Fe transport